MRVRWLGCGSLGVLSFCAGCPSDAAPVGGSASGDSTLAASSSEHASSTTASDATTSDISTSAETTTSASPGEANSSDASGSEASSSEGVDLGEDTGTCEDELSTPTGTVFEGDVVLATADDVQLAAGYREITGSLYVATSFAGPLVLPNLRHVGGDVWVEATIDDELIDSNITELRLPALETIGSSLWIYLNASLQSLDLRRLERIGSRFWVYRNLTLWDIRLDALTSFGEDAQVQGNPQVPGCFADALIEQLQGFDTGSIVGDTESPCACQDVCDRIAIVCGAM